MFLNCNYYIVLHKPKPFAQISQDTRPKVQQWPLIRKITHLHLTYLPLLFHFILLYGFGFQHELLPFLFFFLLVPYLMQKSERDTP